MTEADTIHVDAREADDAAVLTIGDGTTESAAVKLPRVSLLEAQPVRVIGAVQAVAAGATTIIALDVPVWAGLALSVGLYAFEEFKRLKVTPVASPKLDADTPLTP